MQNAFEFSSNSLRNSSVLTLIEQEFWKGNRSEIPKMIFLQGFLCWSKLRWRITNGIGNFSIGCNEWIVWFYFLKITSVFPIYILKWTKDSYKELFCSAGAAAGCGVLRSAISMNTEFWKAFKWALVHSHWILPISVRVSNLGALSRVV